jgi:alpha-N-acetylglucosamine transferase
MNIAFDTLGATKRLRDAGLEERAAEAIVELVHSTAQFPDISGLATKADISDLVTKADISGFATKADISSFATKADISGFATKADISSLATKADSATKADLVELAHATKMDIQALKADLAITKTQILVELNDKLRFQSFALMGGVTAIVGLATAIIKLGS